MTRQNILALPPEIIDAIQTVVDDLNAGASEDEKKALVSSTSTPLSTRMLHELTPDVTP